MSYPSLPVSVIPVRQSGEEIHTEDNSQDLVDLQLSPDAGYKFILNYQDCFSKFVVLRPLRSKTADEVAQCLVHIFCEHGPPHFCTRIMALSSQIRHCSPFYTGYGQAHVSYTADRVTHYVQYSKNISHHRGINATPYSVHFGRTPPDISIDMSLHSVGIAGKNCLSVILAV